MPLRAQTARAAVYGAAATARAADIVAARPPPDGAALRGARDCRQPHGGMGFPWEARPPAPEAGLVAGRAR